jgi:phosphohistidine phosphatase
MPQQVAVIPFRRRRDAVQISLIRRKGSKSWAIPKGFIDPGHTPEQAALNEAYEEAGLRGQIIGRAIGSYEYRKWGGRLTVAVFLMRVREAQTEWDEMHFRERKWALTEEARDLLADHPVRPLLDSAIRRLRPQRPPAAGRRPPRR